MRLYSFFIILSSLVLLVACLSVRKKPYSIGSLLGIGIMAAIGPMCLFAIAAPFQLQGIAVIVLSVLLLIPQHGRRVYLGSLAAVTVSLYGYFYWLKIDQDRTLDRLREEFAFQPIEAIKPPARPELARSAFDDKQLKQLEDTVESDLRYPSRSWFHPLSRLHNERVKEFGSTPGFGAARMFNKAPTEAEIRTSLKSVAVPKPDPGSFPDRSAGAEPPHWKHEDLNTLHRVSTIDFLNLGGFGLKKDNQIAGFQSHGFSKLPDPAGEWTVLDLDLIGLVVHDKPTAYVSKNLPRMDELEHVPTRPLDPFESAALAKLRTGEELVIQPAGPRLRMLGAVRAATQCVECHGGDRGALLGAFSYTLRPVK